MTTYYKNSQWVVDDFGLSTVDGEYPIEASRLVERSRGRYDWPEQVCGKSWVDPHAFLTAYAAALEHFHPDYDRLEFAMCIRKAYQAMARSVRYDIMHDRLYPRDPSQHFRLTDAGQLSKISDALADEDAALAANDNATVNRSAA